MKHASSPIALVEANMLLFFMVLTAHLILVSLTFCSQNRSC